MSLRKENVSFYLRLWIKYLDKLEELDKQQNNNNLNRERYNEKLKTIKRSIYHKFIKNSLKKERSPITKILGEPKEVNNTTRKRDINLFSKKGLIRTLSKD